MTSNADHAVDCGQEYQFGARAERLAIRFIEIPANSLNFDHERFLKLLAGSISLTKEEKLRIIEHISDLSQWQIDELTKILHEEVRKMRDLDQHHWPQLQELEARHLQDWDEIELTFQKQKLCAELGPLLDV